MAPGNDAAIPEVIAEAASRVQNRQARHDQEKWKPASAKNHALNRRASTVWMSTSDFSVRCTGHLSAISMSRARCSASVALEADHTIDVVDLAFFGLALRAIAGVDFLMPKPDLDPLQRDLLVVGVKPHGHRRAGAERREQEIVRSRSAVEPAGLDRLIGQQPVRAGDDFLLELTPARFAHHDAAFCACRRPAARRRPCQDSDRPRRK